MRSTPIAKCCHCGQVRTETRWQHEQNPPDSLVVYSHTYCPVCLQKAMMELDHVQEDVALEMRRAG